MPTRLIFVRHGESVCSVDGVVGGPRGCDGLTSRGHDQARAVAARLATDLATTDTAVYSSVLPRAVETAEAIAAALHTTAVADCGLCTWHVPPAADRLPTDRFQAEYRSPGGGVFRPFEHGNEAWAELVARVGRAIMDLAHRHRDGTVVVVGHSQTVECSFHALGAQPLYKPFDLDVEPASVTEWVTDGDPTGWPPPRWTLRRFNAPPST